MPPRRLRLDAELVRRGLARSRDHASELIAFIRSRVSALITRGPDDTEPHLAVSEMNSFILVIPPS